MSSYIVLTVTPKSNIEAGKIVDKKKIRVINYGWYDPIKVYHWGTLLSENVIAHQISVHDHYIPIDGLDYKIISFFSGPEDMCGPKGSYTIRRRKELGIDEIEANQAFVKNVVKHQARI